MKSSSNTCKFSKEFDLTPELNISVERVIGGDYFKSFKLISILHDAYFWFASEAHPNKDIFVLPKFYAGLTYLTGPSD